MTDILDQNEVDALLKGVATGDIETESDQPPADTDEMTYDLTNPERVIRDKMLSLSVIHDKFIKLFQTSLGTLLSKDVEIQFLSFDVMRYNRFIETIPLPASLSIMRVNPYRGVMIFEMDAKIVFSLMDIFCGGKGTSRFKIEGRDFTNIEQRIIEKIVSRAAEDLMVSWKPVYPLEVTLEKTEINPRFVTAVEKSEMLAVYTFEVAIEQVTCSMKLCIPYSTIEPFRSQLSGEVTVDTVRKQDTGQIQWLKKNLKEMIVNLVVEVGQGEVTFRDLMNLQKGDVIPLDKQVENPFLIKCEGVRKFKGFPGQYKGKMAVHISSIEK